MVETTTIIKNLKPGNYIVIDGEACKVTKITKSKPGKHGSAKVRLEAMGIFDDKKRTLLRPGDAVVEIPIIEKRRAQIVSISGEMVQLMDMSDYSTFETDIPEVFRGKLSPGKEVVYWRVKNKVMIKELK